MTLKCNKVFDKDRSKLANINHGKSYLNILKENKAINIKENHTIQDLGNGYSEIIIHDYNKKY